MEPTILTYTGKYVHLVEPQVESIDIIDIAHALSHICRFTGHTSSFYSVASHCLWVSEHAPEELQLLGLLHDAAEAYLGDVSAPLKQLLPEYKALEHRMEEAIAKRFGLPSLSHPDIKRLDREALRVERAQVFQRDDRSVTWDQGDAIFDAALLKQQTPADVKAAYLARFLQL